MHLLASVSAVPYVIFFLKEDDKGAELQDADTEIPLLSLAAPYPLAHSFTSLMKQSSIPFSYTSITDRRQRNVSIHGGIIGKLMLDILLEVGLASTTKVPLLWPSSWTTFLSFTSPSMCV